MQFSVLALLSVLQNVIDSIDAVQKAEIQMQITLAESLRNKEVPVILEMPGHASPEKSGN